MGIEHMTRYVETFRCDVT